MSYRDRQGQPPSLYDSNNHSGRDRSSRPEGDSTSRESTSSRPWHVDPAEVDRYLAEREEALRLERPDSYQGNRPTPETGRSSPRSGPRSATGDYSLRSSRNQPQPDPSEYKWPDLDDDQWPATEDDGLPDAYEPSNVPLSPPPARAPRPRRRAATLRGPTRTRMTRSLPQVRLPRFVANATLVNDRTSLLLLAVTGFSILVMWIVFASRINHVGSIVPLHLDAVGVPDRWGPAKSLWRLPLLATMLPLMNLVIAWWVARFDQFSSRFLLATGLGLQLLVWIAAIRLLW